MKREVQSPSALRTIHPGCDQDGLSTNGPPSRHGLGWLVHPIAVGNFLQIHWETSPVAITRNRPDYFDGLLAIDDLDELLTATTSAAARSSDEGRLVKTDSSGRTIGRPFRLNEQGIPDIQEIYRAYRSGHSVVLNGIHHRSTPVAELCRSIEADLHHRVAANMYLTPRCSQGFGVHVDEHDVLVIQLRGEKLWFVGPSVAEPACSAKVLDDDPVVLGPGDSLYVPRGWPHNAVSTTSSSLHLTIGIHVHTWADLVREVVALLVERQSTSLQAALPPSSRSEDLNPNYLATLSTELVDAMRDPAFVGLARLNLSRRVLSTAGNAAVRGQFRSIDALVSLHEETMVHRVSGLPCRVHTTGDLAVIEFANNYVSGPLTIEPALHFVTSHEQFRVAELPGELSPTDRIDLIDRLVSEGLLSLESRKRTHAKEMA